MIESQTIEFAGYAGLFDIADAAKDTIRKGAFRETLEHRATPLPLLWQHKHGQQIGTIVSIAEDAKGLRVIAQIERINSRPAAMLRNGSVNGLSFGYRAKDLLIRQGGRELLAIDLFEISLVTHPLQHGARVHLVV